MADTFFAATNRTGKPLLAWTVDTPADLHRGLEMGVNAGATRTHACGALSAHDSWLGGTPPLR